MRISDWSSDVCSSDLTASYAYLWLSRLAVLGFFGHALVRIAGRVHVPPDGVDAIAKLVAFLFAAMVAVLVLQNRRAVAERIRGHRHHETPRGNAMRLMRQRAADIWHVLRSEEHTSEL